MSENEAVIEARLVVTSNDDEEKQVNDKQEWLSDQATQTLNKETLPQASTMEALTQTRCVEDTLQSRSRITNEALESTVFPTEMHPKEAVEWNKHSLPNVNVKHDSFKQNSGYDINEQHGMNTNFSGTTTIENENISLPNLLNTDFTERTTFTNNNNIFVKAGMHTNFAETGEFGDDGISTQSVTNADFSETRTFSDSNDSVLDNSTDGEGSSHKEVFIDYRRRLTRKGSNNSDLSAASSVDRDSVPGSCDSGLPVRDATPLSKYLVVVAIDFGTTYSGYAFAFRRDPDSIHMMRRWEGGDPGVSNTKTPTTLLLTPEKRFHSFGFGARDFYHDLEPSEAKKYMYFEKFKMKLYNNEVKVSQRIS